MSLWHRIKYLASRLDQTPVARSSQFSRRRWKSRDWHGVELLEVRQLLSASDLSSVPFWDGETAGPPDALLNRLGGNPVAGINATVSFETSVVHSGNGAYRIDTNGPIIPGGFDFVGTALTGFGPTTSYVDTRDITNFSEVGFWLKNDTAATFQLAFEIKDFRDSNNDRARFQTTVSSSSVWNDYAVPLDTGSPGWTVIGNPDFSRAKLFSLVIEPTVAIVNGQIFLDDMTFTERGGSLNPQTAPFNSVVSRMAEREFRGLWGARDRGTGWVPVNSAYADVMALNSTAGLVETLPAARAMNWVTQAEADNYVSLLVDGLTVIMDNVASTENGGFVPPRYIDRVTLLPNYIREESPVDAAFLFLALYQYQSLPTTSAGLQTKISDILGRFDFASFSSPSGWRLAYLYDSSDFTLGAYDGYSTEIYVMSLAAELSTNHHIDIETQWNSGTYRTLAYLVEPADTHLVHSQTEYRGPFLQMLFHVFADVSNRGADTYPDPALRRNPYQNAVSYQRETYRKLAELNRPTFAQPDAGDDGTGSVYEQFSMYNNFGQPDLLMPWSSTFGLLAGIPEAETAIRDLLSRDLHGPLGFSDSVVWNTGASTFVRLPARHDFWNTALSMMAMTTYLTGTNSTFAQLPSVALALDRVFPLAPPTITSPPVVTPLQRPQITWNSVPGATEYEIWVTKNPSTNPYHQATVSQTTYTPPVDFGIGKFNLWVRAKNSGGVGPWSGKYTFVINTPVTLHPIVRDQPTLRPTISWDALPCTVKYDIWINDVSRGINQRIRDMDVTETSFTPDEDLPLGVYRAWVRGIAPDGTVAAWSGMIEFVTRQAPTVTQGQNPTFDRTPTFAWNALPGAAQYEVYIRDLYTGLTTLYEKNITALNLTPSTPLPDGPYRWWAIGISAQGIRSFWTAPMDIYIGGRTDLLTPRGSNSDSTPTFNWRPVDGAVRYDLWVNQVGGTAQIIREPNLTGTSYTPTIPLPTGNYRAWIRAVSSTGEISPWSNSVDFLIAIAT